jgi:CBS-domain-containing membrane protein
MREPAARALRGLTARDVMRNEMVTVVPEMTVGELAHTLVEAGVRSVPVLGPAGKVLGVASQTDVTRLALREGPPVEESEEEEAAVRALLNGAPHRLRVRDVMGPVGPTVGPDEPLPALVRLFVRGREHRALVVEHDMVIGIVTPVDVLSALEALS